MATIKELNERVGGLSNPSKMPGFSFSLPAEACKVGSLLRRVEGSTCASCYAMKGRYAFGNVKNAMARRLAAVDSPSWTEDMVNLIQKKYRNKKGEDRVFRWHDSGDIQSVSHLSKIVDICRRLPDIKFWLPSRENGIVAAYLRDAQGFPSNLNVRMSAPLVGTSRPTSDSRISYSSVDATSDKVYQCPAPSQGNVCGDCRACWSKDVRTVNYRKH